MPSSWVKDVLPECLLLELKMPALCTDKINILLLLVARIWPADSFGILKTAIIVQLIKNGYQNFGTRNKAERNACSVLTEVLLEFRMLMWMQFTHSCSCRHCNSSWKKSVIYASCDVIKSVNVSKVNLAFYCSCWLGWVSLDGTE